MKKRTKLLVTIICMFILISAMLVGVWAAYATTLSISGSTVTFNAFNVECNFYGIVKNFNEDTDKVGEDRRFSVVFHEDDPVANKTWELKNISFRGAGDENAIVIRLAVQNYGKENVYVEKFNEPVKSSDNVSFSYRQAWGKKPNEMFWEDGFDSMIAGNYDDWIVADETENKDDISLNTAENYLRPAVELRDGDDVVIGRQSWWFILEIKVVLIDAGIRVAGQSIDFTLEVSNEK